MLDFSEMDKAFDCVKETVTVEQMRDGRLIRRSVPAVVLFCDGQTTAAGAQVATQLADSYSVVISRKDFQFGREPSFGDIVRHDVYGVLAVQQVVGGQYDWTLRCTKDERGEVP